MPQRPVLSPSLLSSDFSRLGEELDALADAGLEWVHWDVMDGRFVPNITLGPPIIKALRKRSRLFFDVHLMIVEPERYIEAFADAGADLIGVHAEACTHLERVVSEIARLGARPAVALNPHTPLEVVHYLLPQLDMVLLMTVNPGFGGQSFIPFSTEKIATLADEIRRRGLATRLQVDGGVTVENAQELVRLGADTLVSGSDFFGRPPYAERLQAFTRAMAAGSASAA